MTNKTNTGGPAFPQDYEHTKVLVQMQQVGDISAKDLQKLSKQLAGMTLRDYFAAKAMQSAFSEGTFTFTREDYLRLARVAYAMADEMLKARGQ